MKAEVLTITPKMASEMLRGNVRNRPLNKRHVEFYSSEMALGRWKLNGDSIRFNGKSLIDGQHRLAACIKAGVPFETLVISNLDPDVFDTIDAGRKRTAADTFAVRGEKNYSLLAASLAIVETYYAGKAQLRLTVRGSVSNQQYEEWLLKYPALPNCVTYCVSRITKLIQPSIMTACHYIFSRIDSHAADNFIQRLSSGENIAEDSPMSRLREKLLENYTSLRKYDRSYLFGMILKTWNAERTGRKLARFRVNAAGNEFDRNERFPVAV